MSDLLSAVLAIGGLVLAYSVASIPGAILGAVIGHAFGAF